MGLSILSRVPLKRTVRALADSFWSCLKSTSVPIYDARQCDKGFGFSDGDFAKLSTWPLYGKGKKDLPTDESAVVAVGYTLGTYLNAKTQDPVLSANLQFVILLGRTQ